MVWTSYYYSEYKPNHYMKDWFEGLGTADTLDTWYSGINGKHAFLTLKRTCSPSDRCDPAPARDRSQWLGRGVAYFSEDEAADCFRDGSQHTLDHGGHKAVIECQKVFPSNWEFRVDINLYW
ncbi:hypothetical protein [Actinomadura sp. BRA 177]|uniref:hypothetical protein n=1 Tax=Actinomadura sp. BRA 177 TaxID=2745202 RepID=UPI00159520DA|nr:hypothetical protein [Actinomadura sp. BRA 177]NVI88996.1 hypothetical protein [Actinomadura sp. BRA 177]